MHRLLTMMAGRQLKRMPCASLLTLDAGMSSWSPLHRLQPYISRAPSMLNVRHLRTVARNAKSGGGRTTDSTGVKFQKLGQAAPVKKPAQVPKPQNEIKYIQADLPKVQNYKIKTATYVKSSTTLKDCPPESHPEFAVIGRSNVGKSSLINLLTDNSKLAKVSKEPGLTKCINHFLINNNWYMVDLPGYGYAKSAKEKRLQWAEFTKEYFLQRETLVHVLLLVDSSVPTQPSDLECANWLGESEVPFSIVFTKVDKASSTASKQNMTAFKKALAADWDAIPACFETSGRTGEGKAQVLQYMAALREDYKSGGS